MKFLSFPAFVAIVFITACCTPAKQSVTTVPTQPVLRTLNDSASYSIGISVAKFYQQQGVDSLNTGLITRAINDALRNQPVLLDDNQANLVIMNFMNQLESEKARPNIEQGEKFLEENKKRSGVITTPTGLQYEIIRQGNGPRPTINDSVVAHYMGKLLDSTEVDNSNKRGEPVTFAVNRVISGWTEALQLMPVGSKWKLFIPYQLGYGSSTYGHIPGGSVLIFEIELLGVK